MHRIIVACKKDAGYKFSGANVGGARVLGAAGHVAAFRRQPLAVDEEEGGGSEAATPEACYWML